MNSLRPFCERGAEYESTRAEGEGVQGGLGECGACGSVRAQDARGRGRDTGRAGHAVESGVLANVST